jgi:Acyl-coenzyme A:6-aminopenicillanic acid acyl-transferase
MKKLKLILPLLFFAQGLLACTLFWADRNGEILCAKNMDWSNTETRMLVLPAEEGVYGRVYFGIESSWGFTNTSGMNDRGLWYGGASLPHRGDVVNTYNKPEVMGEIIENILRECATVDEAIAVYTSYWEPHWDGHSMIADRFGNCVVIEYGEDDVVPIRNNEDHMVATNHYLIDTLNSRWINCYRYEVADLMLGDSTAISYDLFRRIADATHAEGSGPTSLTTLHDLKRRRTRVFSMFNYEEYIDMDLAGQLAYGNHYVSLQDYFNKIHRVAPLEGEEVSPTDIELVWTGEGDDYIIRYGSDSSLSTYNEIEYHAPPDVQTAGADWKILILPIFSMLVVIMKKKRTWMVILVFISIFNNSCYRVDIDNYSNNEHRITLDEQVPGSNVYWKVLSTGNDYNSETIIFLTKVVSNEE